MLKQTFLFQLKHKYSDLNTAAFKIIEVVEYWHILFLLKSLILYLGIKKGFWNTTLFKQRGKTNSF